MSPYMTPTDWYARRSIWLTLKTCHEISTCGSHLAYVPYLALLVVAFIA